MLYIFTNFLELSLIIFHPARAWRAAEGGLMFYCGFFFLFFNDFRQPNYLNIYVTDLH